MREVVIEKPTRDYWIYLKYVERNSLDYDRAFPEDSFPNLCWAFKEPTLVFLPNTKYHPSHLLPRLRAVALLIPYYDYKHWSYRFVDEEGAILGWFGVKETAVKEFVVEVADIKQPYADTHVYRLGRTAQYPFEIVFLPRRGIARAHYELCKECMTPYVMVLDDDYVSHKLPKEFTDTNMVWYARNPYNGLIYGHGGLKRFKRIDVLSAYQLVGEESDFTETVSNMGSGLTVVPNEMGAHYFSSSPFRGFCAAFREVYKLKRKDDDESKRRVKQWPISNDEWVTLGAEQALKASEFPINNYNKLFELFLEVRNARSK